MPPRQLGSLDGPVARNPLGVMATLKTCPPRPSSTGAGCQVCPSGDHQASTAGSPSGPAPYAMPTTTATPWPAATPMASIDTSGPAPDCGRNIGSSGMRDQADPSADAQSA